MHTNSEITYTETAATLNTLCFYSINFSNNKAGKITKINDNIPNKSYSLKL